MKGQRTFIFLLQSTSKEYCMSSTESVSCMKSFWVSLADASSQVSNECSESSSGAIASSWAFSSRSIESTASSINWMIENRGGMAILTGLLMVPSQFMGPDYETSLAIIEEVCKHNNESLRKDAMRVETFTLQCEDTTISGVICYPPQWSVENSSRCILYHNPNGITTPGYFQDNELSWTPGTIFQKEQVPIILYDYRGTGLSKNNLDELSGSRFAFHPTYASIAEDGEAVLIYALGRYKHVDVWGSSLGGGVATVSLDRYLQGNPQDQYRVTLHNHDSFSNTARVVMPSMPFLANGIGYFVGGNLDSESSMQNLINRKIPITVLCHLNDPVIPVGARMAEFVEALQPHGISLVYSERYGHADLSQDMVGEVWKDDLQTNSAFDPRMREFTRAELRALLSKVPPSPKR